ncbi:Endonuclease related to archaeal Holliday junction resolvase [uncultured archaeon]|nr:Endonuclease related to archaeal Holliday junction resolvase [uncultured archaeon]
MFELIFIAIIIILIIALMLILKLFFSMKAEYNSLLFSKQSQSVKYGQLTEQWLPFSKNFPFNSQNFRFIGKPVDGVVFEEDKIVFVEFKTNKSHLSDSQKKVKELAKNKKVEWFELRVE